MHIIDQPFRGLFLIEPTRHKDERGDFFKTFHADEFAKAGIYFEMKEEFFSVSCKFALRGMHFQRKPHAHQKIVTCISGSVIDVLVDLRSGESTFGKFFSTELNQENRRVLFVPVGFAHGFLALEDNSCMAYKTDVAYVQSHDEGIHWNSFGYRWQENVTNPIVSERDQKHPGFAEFAGSGHEF